MIYNFNDFLFEYNSNLKYVYHILDFEKLNFVLDNDKISSYKFQNISTTRNPNLNGYLGDNSTSLFKIELNYQKLAKDYEINDFVYKSITGVYFKEEEEEQIKTNEIKNVSKYITKIILIKNRLEYLKDSGWFGSRGGFTKNGRNNIPNLLKEIVEKSPYDLWIQDGEKIYKDDDYINNIINMPIEIEYIGYALYKKEKLREKVKGEIFHRNYEYYIPLDNRNKPHKTDMICIGCKHYDLYLLLKKPSQKDYDDDICLFEFRLESVDDIISVDNGYIHVKKAKLEERRLHGWSGW